MSNNAKPEDLEPEQTEGFKVGEKKTIDEYQQLDQHDESLNKWKASLGLGTGTPIGDKTDPRKVIIKSLGLEIEGRPDIIINLEEDGALEDLKNHPFTIKEGTTYRMKAIFTVHHQLLSGMKYVQVVSRGPIRQKMQEMIGSYPISTTDKPQHEAKFEPDTAPHGMMYRGKYNAVSKFIDDDDQTHLQFNWSFEVKKDW